MIWIFFFIPVISAFIGWIAGFIVIKLLFHPKKALKFAGITFQGFLPKKYPRLALKFGKLISNKFLSAEETEQITSSPGNIEKILPFLEAHIDVFLREKLSAEIPMIGMLIGEKTISQVKGVFMKELKEILPGLIQQYRFSLLHNSDIEKIIVNKASRFSLDEIENVLNGELSSELRAVKIIGAVAGFTIGLIQVLIYVTVLK